MSDEIINAQIESTMLGYEDHGILTCYLHLKWGARGQGFGGYALDKHNGERNLKSRRLGTAYGCEFIARIMQTVGVEKWEDLKGKFVRIRGQTNSSIASIGHIIEDKWFTPETDLKHLAE